MERLIITLTFKKEKFIIELKTIINANGTKIALTPIGAIFIKKYGIINLTYSNISLGILNK